MIIEKKQENKKNFLFHWLFFNSARHGLKYILNYEKKKYRKIILPAYIGYSAKEGSGVFDPIRETAFNYVFYKIDKNLYIDLGDIAGKITDNPESILILIDYFGFKDRNIGYIKKMARQNKMLIIEDFAHAFFTFWLNPVIDFNYAIFSLHKLFPVSSGGMILGSGVTKKKNMRIFNLFNYDINSIIQKRIENYNFILNRLEKVKKKYRIKILRRRLQEYVPQTFPILLENKEIRDNLYFALNRDGYGVISLYHELIEEIPDTFSVEHRLAERILNLPVHQDAEIKDLSLMLDKMVRIIDNAMHRRSYGRDRKKKI